MCGIAGVVDFSAQTSGDNLKRIVETMADTLRHRGPDSNGSWADPTSAVALAHRRLAIIDLSAAGHQPMISLCQRYVISYNGEVYNFRELREQLRHLGHSFTGGSDTEVILAAIVEWGVKEAVQKFVGMFAFAVWDNREKVLYLVRDRLGIKPLFYGHAGRSFVFGSELQSLTAHPDFQKSIDRDSLALFLGYSYVPCPRSIYCGISKLPPGSILRVAGDGSSTRMETYWSLSEIAAQGSETPFTGNLQEATDELEKLLALSIKQRMVADVPLGVFLSGGIDSSTVCALMQSQSGQPIKSYAIGYHDKKFDESSHAEAVARHLGTDHTTFTLSPDDALAIVPRLGKMFDEPFADVSQIPTYLISELARQDTTVVLTGDGGDEIFGGYTRHLWSHKIARLSQAMPSWSKKAVYQSITSVDPGTWDHWLGYLPKAYRKTRAGSKMHRFASLLNARSAGDVYQQTMLRWPDAHLLVPGSNFQSTLVDRENEWPTSLDSTGQLMYLDAMTYLPDDCLVKVDRASMAASLEARVPLIDHRVVEFAWKLPMQHKISKGVGKKVLREVLHRHVPSPLFERPKMGFDVPVSDWLRGPLKAWADDLLDLTRLSNQGLLNPQPIREKWAEHLSGQRDWSFQLWNVLMFQAWMDSNGH